jgi:hypothetical protein
MNKRKDKAKKRKWYNREYQNNEAFREAERVRKAKWYQLNRERLIQKVLAQRAESGRVGK